MIFTQDAEQWLDEVNLWDVREAHDLIDALASIEPVGMFDCASAANGERCLVLAPHAERVLVLASADKRFELISEIAGAFDIGLCDTATHAMRAMNDSRMMPLLRSA